jgi:hypothetical protein
MDTHWASPRQVGGGPLDIELEYDQRYEGLDFDDVDRPLNKRLRPHTEVCRAPDDGERVAVQGGGWR